MAELTKQEMHQQLEACKNKIIERAVSRQEVQTLLETTRDRVMSYVHDLVQVHQQNIFRKSASQQLELSRRVASLELRLQSIEQDLKTALNYLQYLSEESRQSAGTAKPEPENTTPRTASYPAEQRYLYQN